METEKKLVIIFYIGCVFLGAGSVLIWGFKGLIFAIGILLIVAGSKFINLEIIRDNNEKELIKKIKEEIK